MTVDEVVAFLTAIRDGVPGGGDRQVMAEIKYKGGDGVRFCPQFVDLDGRNSPCVVLMRMDRAESPAGALAQRAAHSSGGEA